jgi:hypothetical protein
MDFDIADDTALFVSTLSAWWLQNVFNNFSFQ